MQKQKEYDASELVFGGEEETSPKKAMFGSDLPNIPQDLNIPGAVGEVGGAYFSRLWENLKGLGSLVPTEGGGQFDPTGLGKKAFQVGEGLVKSQGDFIKKNPINPLAYVPVLGPAVNEYFEDASKGKGLKATGDVLADVTPLGLGRIAKKLAPMVERGATKSATHLLQPTVETVTKAEGIAPGVVKRTGISLTVENITKKFKDKMEKVGPAVDDAYRNLPDSNRTPIEPIWKDIAKAYEETKVKGTNIIGDTVKAKKLDKVKLMLLDISDTAGNASIESLRSLKQKIGETLHGKGKVPRKAEDSVKAAQAEAERAILKELHKQAPEPAKLDAEYSIWRKGYDLLEHARRVKVAGGANVGGSIYPKTMTITTRIATILPTTAWHSTSMVTKRRVAKLLSIGNTRAAEGLIVAATIGRERD